jgi:single-strand DNA-binding protein
MNSVNLVGNLTRDPEAKALSNGTTLTKFTIALNEKDKAHFFDIICWERLAENVAQYVKKGDKVAISGKLEYNEWEEQDTGRKRNKIEVRASTVDFMTKKTNN